MNRLLFFFIFFYVTPVTTLMIAANDSALYSSAITYELNGGRFGDNLLSYSRAKWLSYSYGIPLFFVPFPYADQLQLYEKEMIYSRKVPLKFNKIERMPRSSRYKIKKNSATLYVNHWKSKVSINWNDQEFVSQVKEMIAPRRDIETVMIPDGYVSVAVHIRNGGGFSADNQQEKERCPLRFVAIDFFIAQIKRIAQMFNEQRLYVYVFTDHKEPRKLVQQLSSALFGYDITFDYQKNCVGHNMNVLEDFFSMMKFDCLIRPGSHFSRFVERLGENKVVIYPYSVCKQKNKPAVIDVVAIKERTAKGWKTIKEQIV